LFQNLSRGFVQISRCTCAYLYVFYLTTQVQAQTLEVFSF